MIEAWQWIPPAVIFGIVVTLVIWNAHVSLPRNPFVPIELDKDHHYVFVFHPRDISRATGYKFVEGLHSQGIDATILRARGLPCVYKFYKEKENE